MLKLSIGKIYKLRFRRVYIKKGKDALSSFPQLADKVCKLKQTERNEAVFEEKRALA